MKNLKQDSATFAYGKGRGVGQVVPTCMVIDARAVEHDGHGKVKRY